MLNSIVIFQQFLVFIKGHLYPVEKQVSKLSEAFCLSMPQFPHLQDEERQVDQDM